MKHRLNPMFYSAFIVIIVVVFVFGNPLGISNLSVHQIKAADLTINANIPPTLLGSVSATPLNDHQIRLDWQYGSNPITRFQLYNYDGNGYIALPNAIPGSARSYVVDNLLPYSSYSFHLSAVNGYHESAMRQTNGAVTTFGSGSGPGIPAAPSNLRYTLDNSLTLLHLYWDDNAGNENGFTIHITDGAGNALPDQGTGSTPTSVTYKTLLVQPGQTYNYSVKSYNSSGSSSYSSVLTAKVPISTLVKVPTILPKPNNVLSGTQVQLNWSIGDGPTPDYYRLSYTNGNSDNRILPDKVAGSVTSYTISGLTPTTRYKFFISGILGQFETAYRSTNPIMTSPATNILPTAPTNLRANIIGESTVNLFWNDNSTGETSSSIVITDLTASALVPTFFQGFSNYSTLGHAAIGGITTNHTYSYKIRQSGPGGTSAYSLPFTFTISNPDGTVIPTCSANTKQIRSLGTYGDIGLESIGKTLCHIYLENLALN